MPLLRVSCQICQEAVLVLYVDSLDFDDEGMTSCMNEYCEDWSQDDGFSIMYTWLRLIEGTNHMLLSHFTIHVTSPNFPMLVMLINFAKTIYSTRKSSKTEPNMGAMAAWKMWTQITRAKRPTCKKLFGWEKL